MYATASSQRPSALCPRRLSLAAVYMVADLHRDLSQDDDELIFPERAAAEPGVPEGRHIH